MRVHRMNDELLFEDERLRMTAILLNRGIFLFETKGSTKK